MCMGGAGGGGSAAHNARVQQINAAQDKINSDKQAAETARLQAETAAANDALKAQAPSAAQAPIAPVRMVDEGVQSAREDARTRARRMAAGGTLITNGSLGGEYDPTQLKQLIGA